MTEMYLTRLLSRRQTVSPLAPKVRAMMVSRRCTIMVTTLATQMMSRLPVTAKMLRPCAHSPLSTKRNTELSSKI